MDHFHIALSDDQLRAVSSIARDGMRETDNEIIRLMIGEETVK